MEKIFESSFDEGFEDFQGIRELTVPVGWTPAWLELRKGQKKWKTRENQGKLFRPE